MSELGSVITQLKQKVTGPKFRTFTVLRKATVNMGALASRSKRAVAPIKSNLDTIDDGDPLEPASGIASSSNLLVSDEQDKRSLARRLMINPHSMFRRCDSLLSDSERCLWSCMYLVDMTCCCGSFARTS